MNYRNVSTNPAKVCIMSGNAKLGKVLNVSLMPIVSCPTGIPCAKACYDWKACKLRPSVMAARSKNWNTLNTNPIEFFSILYNTVKKVNPKYFRWHVGGDIPNTVYLVKMKLLASLFPATKFLCFTKNTMLDYSKLPNNMVVIASQWGEYVWGDSLPKAYVRLDKKDPIIGKLCPGSCVNCKSCWDGETVTFDKH